MFFENYFVNEEKKIVVCKLENCAGSLLCDLCEQSYPHHPDLIIADTFVGKAKCAPEDTFDVELGKKIARERAIAKLFRAKLKTLSRFMDLQTHAFRQMYDTCSKINTKNAKTIERKRKSIEHILNGLTEVNNG